MQISEKRNNLSLKSEKGKRRLSGWDNIIWKLKKKTLLFPSLHILLNPEEGKIPQVLQRRGARTIKHNKS